MSKFDYDRAARVLVDAAYLSDQEAADRHGISTRTVRTYRRKLDDDPQLAGLFREKQGLVDAGWAREMPGAVITLTQTITRMAEKMQECEPTPEGLHAAARALEVVGEIVLTKEVLDARAAG